MWELVVSVWGGSKTTSSETPNTSGGGMEPCEPQAKPGMLSTRAGTQDQERGSDPCGVAPGASQVYEPQARQFQNTNGDSLANPSENDGAATNAASRLIAGAGW